MKYTDEDINKRLGLEILDPEVAKTMLATFYNTLDDRRGIAIAERLNDEQMSRFIDLKQDGSDDQAVEDWLVAAIPDYETLVDTEAEKLLNEIDSDAEDMLSYM